MYDWVEEVIKLADAQPGTEITFLAGDTTITISRRDNDYSLFKDGYREASFIVIVEIIRDYLWVHYGHTCFQFE